MAGSFSSDIIKIEMLPVISHRLQNIKLHKQGRVLRVLLLLTLVCLLFFGLRPKDYDFTNNVALIEGGGLRFEKYGMAYTQPFDKKMVQNLETMDGFSVVLDFQPRAHQDDSFSLILALHAGNDDAQLIIGQWRTYIIAMNGDDYAHKRNVPRIVFNTAEQLSARILLTLTSGKEGTRFYVDGKLVQEKSRLTLNVPAKDNTRLILGNSPYGQASWKGEIYRLAFYGHTLSAKKAINHYNALAATDLFSSAHAIDPLILYNFEKIEDGMVMDHGTSGRHLLIPDTAGPIEKRILAMSMRDNDIDWSFWGDLAVNFLGFVPLGFLLTVVVVQSASLPFKKVVLFAVLACFCLSLGIEVAQAWLPSRSSSMLDLVMNTFGAAAGSFLFLAADKRRYFSTGFTGLTG